MSDRVSLTINNHIATVTLIRPEKRNALDLAMLRAIVETGAALASRTDIRAVVLTGDGPAFCAGLDTSVFQELVKFMQDPEQITARTHGDSNLFQYASMVWAELPMPVIAAIHGFAFGGGFQIMLGADMRIAAPDTQFSILEGKWGLVPDMGGLVLMRRLARGDIIRRLTYTAEIFKAPDAQTWGFVTELHDDPLARAQELATEIANKSPDATRAAKALIRDTELSTVAETLSAETHAQVKLIGTANQMEAIMAGLQKRAPKFRD